MRDRARTGAVLRLPLMGTGRALRQLPFVAEEVFEEAVAPLRGRGGPGDFQAAGDRVAPLAGAEAVLPAEPLLLQARRFRLGRDVGRGACAVRLAEGVAAGDQGDGLLVVHRHATEGVADIVGGRDRIRVAVRSFGVDVDQAHLHGGQRVFQLAAVDVPIRIVIGHEHRAVLLDPFRPVLVADVAAEPGGLCTPVDVLIRLPDVLAAAAEAERLESHGLQSDVPREDHQVGPGDLPAVLLLDRPEQPTGLVQAHVVRPTIERREPLLPSAGAAAAVADAVGARSCATPCG